MKSRLPARIPSGTILPIPPEIPSYVPLPPEPLYRRKLKQDIESGKISLTNITSFVDQITSQYEYEFEIEESAKLIVDSNLPDPLKVYLLAYWEGLIDDKTFITLLTPRYHIYNPVWKPAMIRDHFNPSMLDRLGGYPSHLHRNERFPTCPKHGPLTLVCQFRDPRDLSNRNLFQFFLCVKLIPEELDPNISRLAVLNLDCRLDSGCVQANSTLKVRGCYDENTKYGKFIISQTTYVIRWLNLKFSRRLASEEIFSPYLAPQTINSWTGGQEFKSTNDLILAIGATELAKEMGGELDEQLENLIKSNLTSTEDYPLSTFKVGGAAKYAQAIPHEDLLNGGYDFVHFETNRYEAFRITHPHDITHFQLSDDLNLYYDFS